MHVIHIEIMIVYVQFYKTSSIQEFKKKSVEKLMGFRHGVTQILITKWAVYGHVQKTNLWNND